MQSALTGHPGGVDAPLHAIVAGVNPTSGVLNLTVSDENGATFPLQGVELATSHFAPSGAYATMPGHPRLKPATDKDAAQVKAESTRSTDAGEGGAAPRSQKTGDASTDPNNTAAGSMTDMQRAEGRGAGLPTTGGMTPKISAENGFGIGEGMTELEREQAANGSASNEVKAKQKAVDDAKVNQAEKSAQESKDAADRQAKQLQATKAEVADKAKAAMPNHEATKPVPAKKAAPKPAAKKAPVKKAAAKKR